MRNLLLAGVAILVGVSGSAQASEGVFDRTAEIERLAAKFKTGTRATVIDAGRELFNAGITDAGLAGIIGERLAREVDAVPAADKIGQQYLQWLAKGLASMGLQESEPVLLAGSKRAKSTNTREFLREEADKLGWYRGRNEAMASRRHFREGDDPEVVRLLNLVMSDDFTYKLFAADRINWTRSLDPRLLEEVNAQVLRYMNTTVTGSPRDQAKTVGMYIKLLGYSGNVGYRYTLEKVLESKASPGTKKHAKEALGRLRT